MVTYTSFSAVCSSPADHAAQRRAASAWSSTLYASATTWWCLWFAITDLEIRTGLALVRSRVWSSRGSLYFIPMGAWSLAPSHGPGGIVIAGVVPMLATHRSIVLVPPAPFWL